MLMRHRVACELRFVTLPDREGGCGDRLATEDNRSIHIVRTTRHKKDGNSLHTDRFTQPSSKPAERLQRLFRRAVSNRAQVEHLV